MSIILETTIGDLTIDLYCEERPNCCKNFLKLCKVKFYNFCLFHSIQKNSVAQTGDPTGTGRGGESIFGRLYGEQAKAFDMEIKPRIKHKKRGQVAMVNDGSGRHTSQFLITLSTELDYLDEQQHTVFGEVVEGLETIEKLNEVYCDKEHRPFQDVRISHTIVLDDPFPDPQGLEVPDRSPEPDPEVLKSDRIAAYEKLNDTEGLTAEEVEERMARREAESNEQLLRIVEDIPDVEGITPNERSLFVCKLNPVTNNEDLEIIFSRFGPIVECSVVKDQKSGESLQYAFIEFERREDCENAYFKMENVLIDDRRIHVDFSQSLHKELIEHRKQSRQQERERKQSRNVRPRAPHYDFVFDDDDDDDDESHSRDGGRHRKKNAKKGPASDVDRVNRKRHKHSPEERYERQRGRRDSPKERYERQRGRRNSPEERYERQRGRRDSPEERYERQRGRHDSPERRYERQRGRRDSPEERYERRGRHDSPEGRYERRGRRDSPEERYERRGGRRDSPEERYERRGRRDSPEERYERRGRRDSPEERYERQRGRRDSPEECYERRGRRDSPKERYEQRGRRDSPDDYRQSRPGRSGHRGHSRDDSKKYYERSRSRE